MDADWLVLEGSYFAPGGPAAPVAADPEAPVAADPEAPDSAEPRAVQWRQHYAAPESLFALSNGYFGLRCAPEEDASAGSGGRRATYVNGFFERSPIVYGESAYGYARYHESIVSVPDASLLRLYADGVEITLAARQLSGGRKLDLRRGVVERVMLWELPDGRVLEVRSERFISLARPSLGAIRCTLRLLGPEGRPEERLKLRLESVLSLSVANGESGADPRIGAKFAVAPFCLERLERGPGSDRVAIRTRESRLVLACGLATSARLGGEVPLDHCPIDVGSAEPRELTVRGELSLEPGKPLVITKYFAYCRGSQAGAGSAGYPPTGGAQSEPDLADSGSGGLLARVAMELAVAGSLGFDGLLEEHCSVLAGFWDACGLELEGPPGLAAAVRFNLFHVFQAAGRDGLTNAAAKGLTGEGYEGHYFWDTEIYYLPLLTYTSPAVARALLEYRVAILDQARQRARELGHQRGCLFPWRTISGAETSAYYPAGTAQYHINADIALALQRYCRAAGDDALLSGAGFELLAETARLWLELGHYGRDGKFRIDEVTGPDEYSALVNNNAYTNCMAAFNLEAAADLADRLAREQPRRWADARASLELEPAEPERWRAAARAMYLPRDPGTGLIGQDDAFLDREPWDLASTPPEHFPLLLHYHPLNIYRKQVLKQPDLLLAMLLRPGCFSEAELVRCFDYYEPLTTGDSSLSHCIMSIASAAVGKPGKAWEYFTRTVRMDLDDLHGNAAHGVHLAAMGGSWLSLVYGFAGFRDDGGAYSFAPRLPEQLRRLSFSLQVSGGRLSLKLSADRAEYSWQGPAAIEFAHWRQPVCLKPGDSLVFDIAPRWRGAILDLDGVVADTARLHYLAWRRLADELGLPFDETANEALKGRSRQESLELVLGTRGYSVSATRKQELCERKNDYYRELLARLGPQDCLPGIRQFLAGLRQAGIRVALASASRNAGEVLARLELDGMFDAVVDAATVLPKPDPEIFIEARRALGLRVIDCVGIEDAQSGIDAIRRSGMKAVGVGNRLLGCDLLLPDTAALSLPRIAGLFTAG